jgi:hypothetical protein
LRYEIHEKPETVLHLMEPPHDEQRTLPTVDFFTSTPADGPLACQAWHTLRKRHSFRLYQTTLLAAA